MTSGSAAVKARSRREPEAKTTAQLSRAPARLRKPVRKTMWMNSQISQPISPEAWKRPIFTTALPREMYAALPRSRYRKGRGSRVLPSTECRIRRPA